MRQHELELLSKGQLAAVVATIGSTPLIPIGVVLPCGRRTLQLKMESFNPTGSSKDRTAVYLLRECESSNHLRGGVTVVESTSGNLGVSLALVCRASGYSFRAVIDPTLEPEVVDAMRNLGAELDVVDTRNAVGNYLESRLARVQELCATGQFVWTNQYSNPANPRAHYETTANELLRQMEDGIDVVVIPVGTGGTLAGIARRFREETPSTLVVAADAYGSVIFGGAPAPRCLRGMGSARPSDFISSELYDDHVVVKDVEAFAACVALEKALGIRLGGSGGASVLACMRYLDRHPDLTRAVCICPDAGQNYESSFYNDEWLDHRGMLQGVRAGAADLEGAFHASSSALVHA